MCHWLREGKIDIHLECLRNHHDGDCMQTPYIASSTSDRIGAKVHVNEGNKRGCQELPVSRIQMTKGMKNFVPPAFRRRSLSPDQIVLIYQNIWKRKERREAIARLREREIDNQ